MHLVILFCLLLLRCQRSSSEDRKIMAKEEFTPRPIKQLKLAIELYNTTFNIIDKTNLMIRHDPDESLMLNEVRIVQDRIQQMTDRMEEFYKECVRSGRKPKEELETFFQEISAENNEIDQISETILPKSRASGLIIKEEKDQLMRMLGQLLALKLKYGRHIDDLSLHNIILYLDPRNEQEKRDTSIEFDLNVLVQLKEYYVELEALEDKLYPYYVNMDKLEPDEITYGLTPLQIEIAKLEQITIKHTIEDNREMLKQFGSIVDEGIKLVDTQVQETARAQEASVDRWEDVHSFIVGHQTKMETIKKKLRQLHNDDDEDDLELPIDRDEL